MLTVCVLSTQTMIVYIIWWTVVTNCVTVVSAHVYHIICG